ncbi:oxidoreductase-like protein [Apiosordaria backusii]|uniref:Oxidoreductase-like protein n=1 Tax=Apiosordaria backusii TaxID=314023 RepID=A0AA39ZV01_9PEZI|nr:oxidoreductase-like protein [Apiosordaria backusii]
MRRTIFRAQPAARAVSRALRNQPLRRSFASTPATPIEPSKEQAHPIGPFYESVLRTPAGPMPSVKPEDPPVTSQSNPKSMPEPAPAPTEKPAEKEKPTEDQAPAAAEKPAEKPAPAPPKDEKPKPSPKAAAVEEEKPLDAPIAEEKKPLKRTRKSRSTGTKVVFGSSLAGPAERAERLARIRNESRLINGVLVPPKPEEPDNCCMSGCVNCVWDRFRDEMEDWAAKSKLAEARVEAAKEVGEQVGVTQDSIESTGNMSTSTTTMDDGGGGSPSNWDADGKATKNLWDEELYKNVPVGIREFMKQEKRLKEKHAREGTLGG